MLHRLRRYAHSTTTQAFTTFMGFELVINVDYAVTHFGCGPSWDDPGEDTEFEFEISSIQIDNEGDLGPEHVPTGAFLRAIEHSLAVEEAIINDINSGGFEPDPYPYEDY